MDKEIAKRWVDALRSGKYTQTNGTLRDQKGYCCLGVLCDITPDKHDYRFGEYNSRHDMYVMTSETFPDAPEESSLPDTIRETFGITANAQDDFINLNDNFMKGFNDIAKYIEATYIDETNTLPPAEFFGIEA